MCLSVPAKIISIDGQKAEVEVYGERRQVYVAVEGANKGDWVLIYSGIALSLIDAETARETLNLLANLSPAADKLK